MKLQHLFEINYGSLIDKDKYDDMSPAEQELYRYTADGFIPPSGRKFKELEDKYPFDGGTLYRGLLFSELEDFDQFMAKIEDGKIVLDGSSSWTPSVSTAIDFARSEKTYFPSREVMAAHAATQKSGDHMSGEGGGVVLKTVVRKGVGIDVDKTPFAKESEVILPEGTYDIEVHKVLRPFRVSHKTPEKAIEMANEVVDYVQNGNGDKKEIAKFVTYLEKSWLDELSPTQVDALILFKHPFDIKKFKERLANTPTFEYTYLNDYDGFNGASLHGGIHVFVPPALYHAASDAMRKRIDTCIKLQIDKLDNEVADIVADLNDRLESGKFAIHSIEVSGIDQIEQLNPSLAQKASKAIKPLRQFFATAYHTLNSREYNRSLKPTDMSDHAKLIGKIVKTMGALG